MSISNQIRLVTKFWGKLVLGGFLLIGLSILSPLTIYSQSGFEDYWIIFETYGVDGWRIYRMHLDGSDIQPITPQNEREIIVQFQSWTPDDLWMVFKSGEPGSRALFRVRPDGTNLEQLTKEYQNIQFESWSPDGEWMIFYANEGGVWDLYRMRADGTDIWNLTDDVNENAFVSWSPDGEWMILQTAIDTHWRMFRLRLGDFEMQRLAEQMSANFLAWSPNGEWLYFASPDSETDYYEHLYRMRPNGSDIQQLTDVSLFYDFVSWTPDSTWMIGSYTQRLMPGIGLFQMRPDGSEFRLLNGPPSDFMTFSPDGNWLYYFSEEAAWCRAHIETSLHECFSDVPENFVTWLSTEDMIFIDYDGIYIVSADGSNVQWIADSPGSVDAAVGSPDGEWLIFATAHTPRDIYRLNLDSHSVEQLTDTQDVDILVSLYPANSEIP